jgi:Protein of unknown function (DUF402)
MRYWNRGEVVVLRGVWQGKLWWACPMYVVQDSQDLSAFYWPVGTPTRSPVTRPSVADELYNRIELEDRNWTDNDILSLHISGSAFAIELMWTGGTRELNCWYVHLQEPLRRTEIGFDTMDQMLDIVISPDQTSWQWKDEDEFMEAETLGVYSHATARSIRAEGEHVIHMLHANASPFCDGWESWRPPADWSVPRFPQGWKKTPLSGKIQSGKGI